MKTPPRHASRSHQRSEPRADVERDRKVETGRDHQPMPEPVQALVRDPRSHARRLVAERARHRSENTGLARSHLHERAFEDAVVVAGPARRLALRRRCARRFRRSERAPRHRSVHDAVARLARPGPVHVVDKRQRRLGPLPVGDVAEGLLEAELVAALAELRGVRDEVARHGMEGCATAAAAVPSSLRTTNASAASASANATRTPTIARRRVTRSPQSIPLIIRAIPQKGTTRSRGFYPHAFRPLGSTRPRPTRHTRPRG